CDDLINQVNLKSVEILDLNASLWKKVLVIISLKDDLRKLKGKALVDNDATKHPSDPKKLKIDVEPITPKLLNKRTAHFAYIKHIQEEATVLKDLVEHVKLKYLLDQTLEYVVQIVLWYLDSSCSKHMTGDRSQLTNFVNKFLARHSLIRGLPKLKFEKDHLCSACAMGKSKKKPHKPKSKDTNQEKLYLLHMDLCGPMRVASVNGKNENLGKLQPKADIGIFIGYAPTKKAFQIYNQRTGRNIETIHVDIDELNMMASEQSSSGPALYEMTPATINSGLVPNPPTSTPFIPPDEVLKFKNFKKDATLKVFKSTNQERDTPCASLNVVSLFVLSQAIQDLTIQYTPREFFDPRRRRIVSIFARSLAPSVGPTTISPVQTELISTKPLNLLFQHDKRERNYTTPSPPFVEANYEVLESLLRERRKHMRNEDLRTDQQRERVVEFKDAPNREGSRVERNPEGGRPSKRRVEDNRN
nr:integrase, catalytic region, zinc finger, CCHC-type, peptidase aspartic, catalytic [Tanacetum cinerariifolium]